MEAIKFIDKKWNTNKIPLPIKEQWAELMEDYAKYYHTEQLRLHGVVKSLKDKEVISFKKWFKTNCEKVGENEFLYIDTTYTKEHIFQKWRDKDV